MNEVVELVHQDVHTAGQRVKDCVNGVVHGVAHPIHQLGQNVCKEPLVQRHTSSDGRHHHTGNEGSDEEFHVAGYGRNCYVSVGPYNDERLFDDIITLSLIHI